MLKPLLAVLILLGVVCIAHAQDKPNPFDPGVAVPKAWSLLTAALDAADLQQQHGDGRSLISFARGDSSPLPTTASGPRGPCFELVALRAQQEAPSPERLVRVAADLRTPETA